MYQYIDPYSDHSEIHTADREYIEFVSCSPVEELSIEEINEFLEFVGKMECESDESV